MEKKLSTKQMIFAEFIRLELIEQAIEYAKDAKLSDEEQQEALRNKAIERINELLKNVEPLKFSLEISTNQDEIEFLRNEIKAQYVEINELREKLNLVRGEK